MDALLQDLRYAVRTLRKSPGFTLVAILSLTLGLGANTAIFSVVNGLVLKSLPVSQPEQLFLLSSQGADPLRPPQFSYATFKLLRHRTNLFDGALGFTSCCGKSIVTVGGQQQMVDRQFVTGDFFATLGVRAIRGRLLTLADDEPGAPDGPVVVIGYRMWQERLGGRDDVAGSRLTIDGTPVAVVGVAPPDFHGLEIGRAVDLMVPQHLAPQMTTSPFDEDTAWLSVIVRLKPAVTPARATAALQTSQPDIRAASLPKKFPSAKFLPYPFALTPAATGTSALRQRFEQPLFVLFIVVGFVLLIACANIANLLLARAAGRRHELSVRVAIGASRWRLARQFLVESLLLSAAGAAGGLLVASWGTRALLLQLSSSRQPITLDAPLDWRVLAFTTLAAGATAILFGTVPALRATTIAPSAALKAPGRGSFGDHRTALANGLIVVQLVLSLLLVVAAGLFAQTVERLTRVPLGFDRDHALVVTVAAPTISAADRPTFFVRLTHTIDGVPGVAASGGALNPPIIGELIGDLVVSPPGTRPAPDADLIPEFDSITPRWFAAYGISVERGRDFDERDTRISPPVMIVNEAFARDLFHGRNVMGMPLALTFRFPTGDYLFGTRTIVGIVADSVQHSIRNRVRPMVYVPLAQREPIPQKDFYMGVRSAAGSPELLERAVAAAMTAFSPPVAFSFEPLAQLVNESLVEQRVLAMLSGFFAALALLLAALGLYGVTAYAVAVRRFEIGIRMALGATPGSAVATVLSGITVLVVAGIAIGVTVSLWTTRFVASLLYGVHPRDISTLIGATTLLAVVCLLAGWLPARRAASVNPIEVLRAD